MRRTDKQINNLVGHILSLQSVNSVSLFQVSLNKLLMLYFSEFTFNVTPYLQGKLLSDAVINIIFIYENTGISVYH